MKYQELIRQMEHQNLKEELELQKEAEALYKKRVENAVDQLKQETSRSSKGLSIQGRSL